MGAGYICKCQECEYTFEACLGVGMLYPTIVKEEIKKMKKGRYGEQGMRFFKEHPDGSISCKNVVTKCTVCGSLEVKYDFDLIYQRPEDNDEASNSVRADNDSSCVIEKYNHFCKKCGNKAEIVEDFEDKLDEGEIKCPKCKGALYQAGFLCWD